MICSKECCPKVLQMVIGNRSRLWISDAQNSFRLDLALCASDLLAISCSKALLVAFYLWHIPSRAAIQLSHSRIGMKATCSSCVFLVLVWIGFTRVNRRLGQLHIVQFVDQIPFQRQFYLQLSLKYMESTI